VARSLNPLPKGVRPPFIEHTDLGLQKQVRATLYPPHLLVHDNSLASLLLRLLECMAPPPPIAIFQCLRLSIPRFETIQPSKALQVLASLSTFRFNERWILPNPAIPATLGLAMSRCSALAQTGFGLIKTTLMDVTSAVIPGDPTHAGDQSRNVTSETVST
jgi:hypothetical protein